MEPFLQQMEAYQTQLERIFIYYCSFADKENLTSLKIQNYRRLLLDLQIPTTPQQKSQVDLIFYSHAQTKALSFQTFLPTLIEVSFFAFQEQQKAAALRILLTQHIQPLYDVILKQTEFGQSLNQISVHLMTQNCFIFLKRFESGLTTIYKEYFRGEGSSGKEQQFKIVSKLSRDLTLVPRAANKPLSYLIFVFLRQRQSRSAFEPYFGHALSQNNKVYRFSFICFLQYLIILSALNFKSQKKELIKIYRLLELMEVSPGCQSISKRMKMQHFFLTQKQLQQAINIQNPQILYNNTPSKHQVTSLPLKSNEKPQKRKLGGYYDRLKSKFAELCGKRHVQTNFYLSEVKAKQLLSTICPKLTMTIIQLIVDSFERINFDNFVGMLEAAAERLDIRAECLFEQALLYNTEGYNLAIILEHVKLRPKQSGICHEMLKITHSYLRSIYEYYETNKYLNLNSYVKILQEMGVTPQIVKPKEASDIFKACSQNEVMGLKELQQSLLAIIIAVNFDCNLQGPERLIYLLEKMCESKRGQILMKKNFLMVKEHPLYLLRLTFSDIYSQIQRKIDGAKSNASSESQFGEMV